MILLTGASGFLGREIRASLNEYHLNFLSIGRSPADSIQWDFSGQGPLLPPVDIVVHAAGKAHIVPKNEEERKDFFRVNVQGTQNLLNALEHNPSLQKFVFISSVAVYGLSEGTDITENSPLLATDPYGKSKIAAEKLVADWCVARDIDYYILRLPLIAGKNAPGNLGAMVKGIKRNLYISIGKAVAKKSMVLAKDVADFIAGIQGPSGVYNLTDGHHPGFGELENKISAYYGKNPPLSLPVPLAKILGYAGNLLGAASPINADKIKKITSTHTFNDDRARKDLNWHCHAVLDAWEIE